MRPIQSLALLLLLPLGACGVFSGGPPREPETPDQQACREEARSSPAMKELDRQRMPMNDLNEDRMRREQPAILARAYRDCMRARGANLPGGVQAVQPRR